jgi:hypothetical protein
MKRKNRQMFTSEELKYAAQILSFFAPPPRCICGSKQFKFCVSENNLHAFCIMCGKHYLFEPASKKWSSHLFQPYMAVQTENYGEIEDSS